MFQPGRWFKDSCQDPQLTMLNVLGKPDDVIITMENGTELVDGAILGPYTEGSNLLLRCHAKGGRPIPEVMDAFLNVKNWDQFGWDPRNVEGCLKPLWLLLSEEKERLRSLCFCFQTSIFFISFSATPMKVSFFSQIHF